MRSSKFKNNNKSRGKGKPNDVSKSGDYMKGNIKSGQNDISEATKSQFNDLRWYVVSDQILKDAARLPYNIPVGLPYQRDCRVFPTSDDQFHFVGHAYDNAIPGLFVSSLMPMLGDTADGSSAAVNIAANSLYQYVRSRISGSRTYRPVDMMLYMGAMDSLYCYLTWLTRLYATVYTYHEANRYLSRAIIEAQNVDYDDLVAKLPQFRTAVNVMIAKTRSLYLPSVLPIFLRHSWMFSHYFIEGPSEKDQIYFHIPAGYHVFTKDDLGAGALASVCLDDRANGPLDVDHLIGALASMIDPIYQDEDFNRIAGDMLKAYEGNVFTLTEIPDIATVQLSFNEEVLLQFKNAKYKNVRRNPDAMYGWLGGCFAYYQQAANDPNLHVRIPFEALDCVEFVNDSGTNGLAFGDDAVGHLPMMWSEWSKDTVLTSPHSDVDAGENMINSRLTLAFSIDEIPDGDYEPEYHFGSEWPVCYYLFTYHKNKSTKAVSMFGITYDRVLSLTSTQELRNRALLASEFPIRSAFKYLPELTLIEAVRNNEGVRTYYESGRSIFEVDNYSIISPLTVKGMHTAAILGEYNIPSLSLGK